MANILRPGKVWTGTNGKATAKRAEMKIKPVKN